MASGRSILLSSWPGLRRLWRYGDFRSLGWALAFAATVNLALVDLLVWPELILSGPAKSIWLGVVVWWLASFLGQWIRGDESRIDSEISDEQRDALFIQAQTEYLSGNWEESQWLIEKRLSHDPRDIEARLLLATMFRHRRQFDQAREQLKLLQRFDESRPWCHEIEREFELLLRLEEYNESEESGAAEDPATPAPEEPVVRRAA